MDTHSEQHVANVLITFFTGFVVILSGIAFPVIISLAVIAAHLVSDSNTTMTGVCAGLAIFGVILVGLGSYHITKYLREIEDRLNKDN